MLLWWSSREDRRAMMDIKYLKWGWVTPPQCICVEDEKLGTLRIEANCSYIVYFRRRTTHKISWGGRACLRNLTRWRCGSLRKKLTRNILLQTKLMNYKNKCILNVLTKPQRGCLSIPLRWFYCLL